MTDKHTYNNVIGELNRLGISFDSINHKPVMNMKDGETIADRLGVKACKNLFLVNRQGEHFLLLMSGEKKLDAKELARQAGSSHLSFADDIESTLGAEPGAVSVLGLLFDTGNNVELLVDKHILNTEWLGCHPCVNTCSIKLRMKDIIDVFLPAVHHTFKEVEI